MFRDYLNYKLLKQNIKESITLLLKDRDKEKIKEFSNIEEIKIYPDHARHILNAISHFEKCENYITT